MHNRWANYLLSISVIAFASSFSVARAQNAALLNVRYCGLAYQGEKTNFDKNSTNLTKIYNNKALLTTVNAVLFDKSRSGQTALNLYSKDDKAGQGATMGLSHVLTYETVDPQQFTDPRDGKQKFNIAYGFGINTVLFDLNDRQIKALNPAIIVFNDVAMTLPTPAQSNAAFAAVFAQVKDPESAMGRWLAASVRLPIRQDERNYFRVAPIELADEVKAALDRNVGNARQTSGLFIKNLSSQYEALLAEVFGKPIVPAQINDKGEQAQGNQYVATIPDCLGQNVRLTLPDPSYEMHLRIEKLVEARQQHALQSMPNLPSRGAFQTEIAYGGRYISSIVPYQTGGGASPIDSRTFRFAKSLRFSGERTVNSYEQDFKLSSNFIKDLLTNYTTQDKSWLKANISASVTEKNLRDPGRISKDWKQLIAQRMGVTPYKPAEFGDQKEAK